MSKLNCTDPDYVDRPNSNGICSKYIDKAKNILSKRLDEIKINDASDNLNKNLSDCECGTDRVNLIGNQPKQPLKHPIVNLCMPYIESVFFQYDSAPGTNAVIAFNNDKLGRIIKFTLYLDSGAGDNVIINCEKVSANLSKESLIQFVEGGNTFVKGTFISQTLVFNCNMKIKNDEKIQLTFSNAGVNDITIMAIADIKYAEEDFE